MALSAVDFWLIFFIFLETLVCSYCRGISIEIHLVIIYFLYNFEHL